MKRREEGFSLLEAIVALVILSVTAVALYEWQGANLIAIQRAEAHAATNELTRTALSIIDTVNPMEAPKGHLATGNYEVRWSASLLNPVKPGVTAVGLPGFFDLGLYDMQVTVQEGPRTVVQFHVRQVGYKQTRFPSGDM